MTSRWMRVARGTIAAVFATFIAAFSHVIAGGALPHVGAIALSLAFAIVLCVALAGRTVSLWRTVASVVFSQFVFHTVFSGMTAQSPSIQSMDAGASHQHLVTFATTALATSTHHSAAMWFGHAVAALLTIVAIRGGERAIIGLRTTASLVVARLVAVAALVRVVPTITVPRADWSRTDLPRDLSVSLSTMRHRGPPAFANA
jgi:hypothetical protein